MKKITQKKAQGHIEVIISFVIFLGFLVFLIIIFKPFKTPINPGIFDSVLLNLDKKVGVSIKSISINLKNNPVNCITFNNPNLVSSDTGAGCTPQTIIIKDQDGNILQSNLIDNTFYINTNTKTFFTIYCGSSLEATQTSLNGCTELTSPDYILGIVVEENLWSMEKLSSFSSQYQSDYTSLKNEIVTKSNDFGLVVSDLNSDIIFSMKTKIPRSIEVSSKTISKEIIDKTASTKIIKADILIW